MKRLVIVLLFASVALAQRQRLPMTLNSETPEGQMLQQIGQEAAADKKLVLIEEFVTKYPAHEATGWALVQLQMGYLDQKQFDKALEAGEKLLKLDPMDAEVAHQNLKAAEGKKDPSLVTRWSGETAQIAQKVIASPQPPEESQVDEWKRQVEFSKQVIAYTEYSLYALAVQLQEPREQAALIETLEQRNPKSEYLDRARSTQFTAYLRMQDMDKAVGVAEKVLAKDENNEDMLILAAGYYLEKKTEPEKVLAYAGKSIQVLSTKPTPQGVVEAEWKKRAAQLTGRAYWIQGKQYFNQNKLKDSDKALRAALPDIEEPGLKADTLFHLGLINYRLQNIMDAVKFNEQCAAIKSPYQATAQKNLRAIRSQYREVR